MVSGCGHPIPVAGHMVLGEIYLQMATAQERPPLGVILRNLPFVVTNVPFAAWKAKRYFEEAIRRSRSIDTPGHLARSLLGLGALHKTRKRTEEARACFTEALEVAEQVRDDNIAMKAKEALTAI